MLYSCKLTGDFNSLEMLNTARSLGVFGGMGHSTRPDSNPPEPTTEDSEITFSVHADNADSALSDIRHIANTYKAEQWTGYLMIFPDDQ